MLSNTLPDKGNEIASQYVNAPMEYTVNYNSCKMKVFRCKNVIFFLIFAQNKDCWYTVSENISQIGVSSVKLHSKLS